MASTESMYVCMYVCVCVVVLYVVTVKWGFHDGRRDHVIVAIARPLGSGVCIRGASVLGEVGG